MSVNRPLGATPQTGAIDLRSPARTGRTAASSRLGLLALGGMLLLTLLVCVAASRTHALLPQSIRYGSEAGWLGPLGNAHLHLPAGVLIPVLSLLFGCYVLAVRCAERLSPRAVLTTIAGMIAIVLLAPPLMSTDVYSYEVYARMFVTYGASPYLHGPYAIEHDFLYSWVGSNWWNTPTVYGSVFTLFSALVDASTVGVHTCLTMSKSGWPTLACQHAVALDTAAYKLTAAVAALAVIALLWHAARLRGLNQIRAVAVFGLNPLVIVYGVGGGHNDLMMLAFTTLGLYALLARRERWSGAMIVIGAAVKLTGGLLLPFALASEVGLGAERRRRAILIGAGIAGAAALAAGMAFFGFGQFNVLPTLQEIQTHGDSSSIPGFLSMILHLHLVGHLVGILLGIVFVAIFVVLLRRVLHGRMDFIDAVGWATAAMLVLASAMLPWYVAWLMPLVALGTSRRLWLTGMWLSGVILMITMISYLPNVS